MKPLTREPQPSSVDTKSRSRRELFGWGALGVALVAAYGTFGAFLGRFLDPPKRRRDWLFVAREDELTTGAAKRFVTPKGETVNITRQGEAGELVALSSVCPHLGCQVHWEPHNDRFFCPCHNGVFDASGRATAGPPAEAGQSLLQYPLRSENGLVYIELPSAELSVAASGVSTGASENNSSARCAACTARPQDHDS